MNKVDVFNKEYEYIKNVRYKEDAKKLVELLPDYFFEVAASSTGKYHPSFALGEGGLVRHTKVAVRFAYELSTNQTIGSAFTSDERDLMIVALLVHDGLKHGREKSKYVTFDHPLVIGEYIKENKDKLNFTEGEIEFLVTTISSHMGEWTTNSYSDVVLPEPKNRYQRFVHMCDFLASRKFVDVKFEDNEIVG